MELMEDRKNRLYPHPSVDIRVHPCCGWLSPRTVAVGLLALLVAACAQPAPPGDNFYRLDVAEPAQRQGQPWLTGVLEVNRLDTDGVLAERALAYQDKDGSLARYRYDLWAEAPGGLIQDQLVETLRAHNAATQVVTPDLRVPPDWALRGKLKRFELLPAEGKVTVRMQLSVVSAKDGALVLLETYAAEAPSAADPKSASAALARATADIFARFAADLAKAPVPSHRR